MVMASLSFRDPNSVQPACAVSNRVRVLVVEDHPLLGSAFAGFLNAETDLTVVGVARTGAEAACAAARGRPDVVLMGCRLPDMTGSMAARRIRTAVPSALFVFHSAYDSEPVLLDAIDSGAVAYLAKSATANEIVDAIRQAALGQSLIPAGFAEAIARQQKVSIVHSQLQAVVEVVRDGLVKLGPPEIAAGQIVLDGHTA
jgi:DNA-binding NarL/FixJ family response regulator